MSLEPQKFRYSKLWLQIKYLYHYAWWNMSNFHCKLSECVNNWIDYIDVSTNFISYFFKIKISNELTCCRNSLSGTQFCSQLVVRSSLVCWKNTLVSLEKFFPKTNSSRPPVAGHEVRDFLLISGTPGGCAEEK